MSASPYRSRSARRAPAVSPLDRWARAWRAGVVLPATAALAFAGVVNAPTASAASVSSASFSGGTGTVTANGRLYAKQGQTVTLNVTTSSDTKCVQVGGAFSDRQTSTTAKSSWSFSLSAPAGNGAQSVTVAAGPGFNATSCTGQGSNDTTQASYTLDNAGPVVSATKSPAANTEGWNKDNVTVTWSATDAGSGVATGPTPSSVTETANGRHVKTSTATDRLGNVGNGSTNVLIDKASPNITSSETQNPDGTRTISFTCDDPGGSERSGIATCLANGSADNSRTVAGGVTVTGTATDNAGNTATTSRTATASDTTPPNLSGAPTASPNGSNGWYKGNVTIRWSCSDSGSGLAAGACPADDTISSEGEGLTVTRSLTDIAGNTTTATSAPVKIDKTAPNTGISGNSNNWVNGAVSLTLTPSDNRSGVASTTYKVNGGAAQSGRTVSLSSDGEYTVEFFSTDNAGNVEAAQTVRVKIDQTAPSIRHSFTPSGYTSGTWTNGNVTVSFDCEDQGSGIASCTGGRTVSDEGADQQVVGTATDNAGNSANSTALVSIDKTAPRVTASVDREPNAAGWYNDDVRVSFSAIDALSGVARTSADAVLGQGMSQSATGSATDAAGNTGSASVTGIKVDKAAPALSADFPTGWNTGDVTVRWTCTDTGGSGVKGAQPANTLVEGEGDNLTATTSCEDVAGNITTETVSGIKIDRTAPTTQARVDRRPNDAGWYAGAVQVTLNAEDNLSDVNSTKYSVNGGAAQNYTGPFSFAQEGTHSITFWSTDGAGNTEEAGAPLTLRIDRTAPDTQVINPVVTDPSWSATGGIPVAFRATDTNGSGIAATYYAIDGGARQTYGEPFTAQLSDGTHTITYWSVDIAGNVEMKDSETFKTVVVNVDTQAPTVTPGDVTNTIWRNSDLSQAFTASDSGSGLADNADASFSLTASAESTKNGGTVVPTSVTKTVADKAGNATTRTVSALIDRTSPTAVSFLGGPAANQLYYNDTVPAAPTCTASDSLSGVQECVVTGYSTAAGAQTLTATATDKAGNTATASRNYEVAIDRNAPVVTPGDVIDTTWRNSDLSQAFTASDSGSGLADNADASFSLTASAESTKNGGTVVPTSVSKTVADKAGNATTRTVSALIDRTGPAGVSFVGGPAEGIRYHSNTVPATPTCTATDSLSGFDSCTVTGYSTALGQHTLTATATDRAGNTATATRSYSVVMRVSGFYAPVDGNGVYNTIKGGNTVPLKFEVFDGIQELRSTTAVKGFSAIKVTCDTDAPTDAIELFATTGQTELRFDTTGDQFIQNWKTPTGSGCYRATMTTVDGQSISALFKTLR